MKSNKIVVIGAGSASFGLNTLGALMSSRRLAGSHIALVDRNPETLQRVNEFNHWAQTDTGPVRIHLLRFTTRDAPKAAIEALGGVFKPISLLRSSAMSELVLLREVFNLIVGAGVS